MIQRRALADLLIEIADGLYDVTAPVGLRATEIQVALPIDVEMCIPHLGPNFVPNCHAFARALPLTAGPTD